MVRRLIMSAAFAACSASPLRAQVALPPNFVDDTIVTGLDQPNAMAFLPDGRLLVTELETGKVRLVVNGHLAATDPVVVDSVSFDGAERGLQGIAVDPRWPQFPYVYVCHTQLGDRMRLIRYTATGDVSNPIGENLALGARRVMIHDFPDAGANHNGLGLRFGTDGCLLMSTGDDEDRCSAQVAGSLKGKLLRLDVTRIPAGGGGPVPRAMLIPADNPISSPDSNARLVLAQGFRNPWRFHVDPLTGAILLGDVGDFTYEELDEVVAGLNYGWPYREGPTVWTVAGCTEPNGSTFQAPIYTFDRSTGFVAILTAGVYRPVAGGTANWPSLYGGNLFYTDYYNSGLRRLIRSGPNWIPAPSVPGQPNSQDWAAGLHFVVDAAVGPDGSLWWLKSFNDASQARTGMVRRIRYTGTVDVPLSDAGGPTLTAAPNPFRESIEIAWRLPAPGPLTIEIFDVTGRRVRALWGPPADREGRIAWDGRDASGVAVKPGLYLARLKHPSVAARVRLLRIR